jgi:rhamnogalacturonyl hydrolase YesR
MRRIFLAALLLLPLQFAVAQESLLGDFPAGYTPQEVGKRVAYRFLCTNFPAERWIDYPKVCTWIGALRFADATHNQELSLLLQEKFEPMFITKECIKPRMHHVDWNMFGCLPLLLYQQTGREKYLDYGLPYADTQWTVPADAKPEEKAWADKGYTWQTRMWIDDMFMITIVQTQAYKVTGEQKYLDRAAYEMVHYLEELQRPNGLFYHAPDVPFYWGRGNGWMAAGMTELLKCLPENHPNRARIMKGYRTMMASLLKYQGDDGMWKQLLDQPDCWAEASGSAMFTYAFINGVQRGWLDAKTYAPAARKAWMAMVGEFLNSDSNVINVCEGTNKKNDKQYYYDRRRNVGDLHGQAPYLWCAVALLGE